MKIRTIYILLLIGAMFSCSETNSESQLDRQQAPNSSLKRAQNQKSTPVKKINTSNLIGIWGDGVDPNAVFEIEKDDIYYTEDQDKRYKYKVKGDTLIIKYDDYVFKGLVKKNDKDSLIIYSLMDSTITRYNRFKN